MTKKPLLPLLMALAVAGAHGAPVAPQVVAGQASFTQQGNVFSITNTPNTIINWQSFSVNAGEVTRFVQQSADSAVLNRIVGQDPTRILGALQSNGHVFLINPNGILFGKDARVDVNSLTASTLATSDADFLAGRRRFEAGAGAGSIVNQGSIATARGGKVFLLAPDIENSGIVTAPDGSVVLAAGRSVTLADSGNPDLHVVVSAPRDQAVNLGQIVAAGGRIGIYGALVRQRGVVNADSAQVGANGKIVLKASADTTLEAGSVTSATGAGGGGAIAVLGQRVGITGDALLDASGDSGGGSVLVGGGYQGADALLPNARMTYFGKQASIRADARVSGQGGKVVLWSQDATRAYGSMSARGGAGGLVETSGHYLDVNGASVKAGTWLLDPYDVELVADGGTAVLGDLAPFTAGASDGVTTLNASTLALEDKATDIVIQARDNVTFKYPVQRPAGTTGSLSVFAGNDIVIDSALDTNGGALILQANAAPYSSSLGAVRVNAAVNTGNGSFFANGTGFSLQAGAKLDAGNGRVDIGAGGSVLVDTGSELVSGGPIAIVAGSFSLLGGIGPSASQLPSVSLAPSLSSAGIVIAGIPSGIPVGDSVVLTLLTGGLNRIHAASINIGNANTAGDISVNSALTLAPALTNTLFLQTQGSINVNAAISMGAASHLSLSRSGLGAGAISVASGTTLAADSIALHADNINLDGALDSTTGGSRGLVNLGPHNDAAIMLGAGATDGVGVLGLSDTELGRIKTGQLEIGGFKALTVTGLDLTSTALASSTLSLVSSEANIGFSGSLKTAGNVTLIAPMVTSTGAPATLTAGAVTIETKGGIGATNAPIYTATGLLRASNDNPDGGPPIVIDNTGTLNLASVAQTGTGNQGDISITNHGGMTLLGGEVVATQGTGRITLVSHGPLTINGAVASDAGAIALEAGDTGVLSIARTGVVSSVSGNIALTGGSVVNDGSVTSSSGNITVSGSVSGAGAFRTVTGTLSGVAPSLSTCVSDPNAQGCSGVLPSIPTCVSDTSTPGCDVVLPSLSQCVSSPSSEGCSVVLPGLDTCVANPAAPGCGVVLPTLEACVTTPSAPGCGVVLPTLAACVATPAAPGCGVVLPSLASCVATPTAAGCTVVLPSLASCVADPATAACGVVLPSLTSCIANPTGPGCSVVLPGLASCVATPTAPGCAVVLPSLTSCILSPSAAGCSAVLPTLSMCVAAPSTGGCAVVLPSVAACTANPAGAGCAVVLPSLAQCAISPSLPGCSAVLPSLAQCTTAPSLAGCGAVLPTLQACVTTPGAPGCSAVLPSLASCVAAPAGAGCSVVLPALAACVSDPAKSGCQVVLPTLSACVGAPATAGCSVVLPTLAQCTTSPTLQGCAVVLPPVSACVANPDAPGCKVVVPPISVAPQSPVDVVLNSVVAIVNQVSDHTMETKSSAKGDTTTEPAKKQALAAILGDGKTEGVKNELPVKKMYCN